MDTTPMTCIRLARAVTVTAALIFFISCSGHISGPADINRDAASRCVQTIDAWKQELAKLDILEREFDFACEEVRVGYHNATPEGRLALRARLGDAVTKRDEAVRSADALFSEIIRELEYVPHDKTTRARLAMATAPLKDADGVRTPEVKFAMNAVSAE